MGKALRREAAQERIERLDPLRRFVFDLLHRARIPHAEASQAVGRNPTYIAQWLFRGAPKQLPNDVRIALARLLEVDPNHLRPEVHERAAFSLPGIDRTELMPINGPLPEHLRIREKGEHAPSVPVYSDTGAIMPEKILEWVLQPPGLFGAALYALWITRDSDRLRAGDMVYVRPHKLARINDVVVVLTLPNNQVLGAGELVGLDEATATVRIKRKNSHFDLANHRLDKIILAVLQ
jgi:hypothetical protein